MERELNFTLIRKEDILSIETNMDEEIDSFEIEEIILLITEIMRQTTKKIFNNTIGCSNIEDLKVDIVLNGELDNRIEQAQDNVSMFIGELINHIINYSHNIYSFNKKEEIENCSYSLAVFTEDSKEVYETYCFGGVKENEILLGCYAFFKDIVDSLLRKNNPKEKIKETLKKSFEIMLFNIYNYIDRNEMEAKNE